MIAADTHPAALRFDDLNKRKAEALARYHEARVRQRQAIADASAALDEYRRLKVELQPFLDADA